MLRIILVVAATALAASISACSDEPNEITATPTPSASAPVPAAATPLTLPPAGAREFVYSTEIRSVSDSERRWPTRAIVAYDAASGTKRVLLEYGGVGDYPVKEALSEEHLYFATEERLVSTAVDGSGPVELFKRPSGDAARIEDFDVSPDGTKIALVLGAEIDAPAALVFLDTTTGRELSHIPDTAPGFAGFVGYLWKVHWRDDSLGVVVSGGTSSSRPGGMASVMLDGRITVHDQEGFVRLAADGRHVADGTGVLCGDLIGGHEIRLRDLDTSAVLARVTEQNKALTPWAWSPAVGFSPLGCPLAPPPST